MCPKTVVDLTQHFAGGKGKGIFATFGCSFKDAAVAAVVASFERNGHKFSLEETGLFASQRQNGILGLAPGSGRVTGNVGVVCLLAQALKPNQPWFITFSRRQDWHLIGCVRILCRFMPTYCLLKSNIKTI